MNDTLSLLASYIPIFTGISLIVLHKQIIISYEKFAQRNGSAFPRFITTTRLFIGATFLIATGVWKLVEGSV